MTNNWIKKTQKYIKKTDYMCPQGSYGGLVPVNYKEREERPGNTVICKCTYCGTIVEIEWRQIENELVRP